MEIIKFLSKGVYEKFDFSINFNDKLNPLTGLSETEKEFIIKSINSLLLRDPQYPQFLCNGQYVCIKVDILSEREKLTIQSHKNVVGAELSLQPGGEFVIFASHHFDPAVPLIEKKFCKTEYYQDQIAKRRSEYVVKRIMELPFPKNLD